MSISLGTNSGFVSSAPSADPGGTNSLIDNYSKITKHTTPATAETITEVGFWVDNATQEANFEVGLYDDGGTDSNAKNLLEVERTNAKGTTSGWKRCTGLNWSISGSTDYWICVQLDNTTTGTNTNQETSGGDGMDADSGQATISDPWDWWGFGPFWGSGMAAFYAVWEGAEEPVVEVTSINIGDAWKAVDWTGSQINIGDSWKTITGVQINIGDAWKVAYAA